MVNKKCSGENGSNKNLVFLWEKLKVIWNLLSATGVGHALGVCL